MFEDPLESPLRLVRRALRGRYRSAAAVAALLAVVGGVAAFLATPARYVSTGLVHIEGALPTILYPTQENQVPPMFDAYVASQVAFMRSGKLLAEAARSPQMAEAGWPKGPLGVSALRAALTIERTRGEQTIAVSVAHHEPRMAQAAVNAILGAYARSAPDPGGLSLPAKEQALVQRQETLDGRLRELRLEILMQSGLYGRDAVERRYAAKVDELMAMDEKLEQIRLARARLEAGETPYDLDPPSSPLRSKELALLAEIKSLPYPPNHPAVRDMERRLKAIRIQMELLQGGDDDVPVPARLDALEAECAAARDRLSREAAALGRQRIVLAGLAEQVDEVGRRLAATRRRLDEIRFAASRTNADRVSIVGGELPGLPASDRRAGLTAAGMVFGVAGGIALVALVGLRDRRIRFVDELAAMNLPAKLIGVLPCGPAGGAESSSAVERLRLQLQVRDAAGRTIHTLTSGDRCEDKAGIALALAVSLAATGRRTLVVDADFGRAALTRTLGLEGRPGLRDALGDDGRDGVHETGHANLCAMPAGTPGSVRAGEITRETVRRVHGDLRRRFDSIIIAAGALRTDYEACLVAAESDHVVLVVDRFQPGDAVRAAADRLAQLGIEDAEVLFNGAAGSDVRGHAAAASSLHAPARADADDEGYAPLARLTAEDAERRHAA